MFGIQKRINGIWRWVILPRFKSSKEAEKYRNNTFPRNEEYKIACSYANRVHTKPKNSSRFVFDPPKDDLAISQIHARLEVINCAKLNKKLGTIKS